MAGPRGPRSAGLPAFRRSRPTWGGAGRASTCDLHGGGGEFPVKLLLVAGDDKLPALAAQFAADFEVSRATNAPAALELLGRQPMDALVVHLGIGESEALDVLFGARKRSPDRPPGMVVVAASFELRTVVEVMRAGAYDVQLE